MNTLVSLLPLSIVQALLLAGGQILTKIALQHMPKPSFTADFILSQLTNWWWLACGLCFGCAITLWAYILKHFPFSMAYPLSSMAYIFGMLAACFLFHEQVSLTAWIGVACILLGCYLIVH